MAARHRVSLELDRQGLRRGALALAAILLLLPAHEGLAQQAKNDIAASAAANEIADFFSKVGDQIYEDCIFELSQEQVDVQRALIQAYIEQGASSAVARRLAVKQIEPPKPSPRCEAIRHQQGAPQELAEVPAEAPAEAAVEAPAEAPDQSWVTTTLTVPKPKLAPARKPAEPPPAPVIALADKKPLPQWDCAPGVDYVTIKLNGFHRKLTGGEICNPFEDVVREVPVAARNFRLGYTIKTGRLFIDSEDPRISGRTIAWALSGRDVCRNNPDPDCFAAKAVGPLPPGEYSFSAEKERRVSWGPKTKRYVAGIYLRKLWNQDRFNERQMAGIRARGNIAIHARLKGEMSEACIGLEPKGWAYVASLIKEGRATGLNAYIEEPYPQIAETPPVVVASTFSLTSLFK